MSVQTIIRKVYFSPSAKRSYLTKKAAYRAEAVAKIKRKYPTEYPEHDEHGCTYGGWHWSELPKAEELLKRYIKVLMKATKP